MFASLTRALAAGVALALSAPAAAAPAATSAAAPATSAPPSGIAAVDLARSKATFSVSHLLIANVTGSVPLTEVTIERASADAVPTSVRATMDPRRIRTGDGDRDRDLQGPDWFDSAAFPVWTFAGDRVTPGAGGAFTVAGTLTVHGVAQPLVLAVTTEKKAAGLVYRATTHADRHGFGMTKTRADALVGGDIRIDLDVAVRATLTPRRRSDTLRRMPGTPSS